jgi:hypothetical protein
LYCLKHWYSLAGPRRTPNVTFGRYPERSGIGGACG